MQANQSLTQSTRPSNGHTPTQAFEQAFCSQAEDNRIRAELLTRWSLSASEAIGALIDWRSTIHRWQAAGDVPDPEFMAEVQKMSEAGMLEWLDANPLGLDDLRSAVTGGER